MKKKHLFWAVLILGAGYFGHRAWRRHKDKIGGEPKAGPAPEVVINV